MTTERAETDGSETGQRDLRARRRYPLQMFLSGQVIGRDPVTIAGETVNISSQGILFFATQRIPDRAHVQLQINWPVRTDQGEPMQLIIFGTVTRSCGYLVAARIWSHALRVVV